MNTIKQDEELMIQSKKKTIARLLIYLLDYKKKIMLVLLLMAGSIAIITVNPLMIEYMINQCIREKNIAVLIGMAGIMMVMNLILIFFVKKRMRVMGEVSNDILMKIRGQLYTHLQTLSIAFFDSRPTGKLLARVIGDVNSLRDVLEDSVVTLIPELLTIIVVAVIMLVKNAMLAAAVFITLPFLILGMGMIEHFAHLRWQIHRKKCSNVNAYVHENFSGIRVVQSFTSEEKSMKDFDQLLLEQRNSFLNAVVIQDAFGSVIDFSWALGAILLYYIGIKILGTGMVGVGTFLAFSTYLGMFWAPINNIGNFYNKLVTNISAAERIFEVMDQKPDIEDFDGAKKLGKIQGNVKFDHVTFAYKGDKPVLEDVSFEVKAGETIALVGETGAGKSTIANLISRFYDVQSGRIWIEKHEIREITMKSLRSQMGVMTQDNFLFSGTVRDNIRYGKLDASDEEIEIAAKAVCAHEFIMNLEHGYDTEISERVTRLSTGQKQLLAFARTMVAAPRILILDEATSNIDTKTEQLVQKGIQSLLKGRTSFIVAHRLSTIRKADRIFVIQNGGIVEEGNHETLMKKQGIYYQLQIVASDVQEERGKHCVR